MCCFYTNDVLVFIMILFKYFSLSHSPFPWININKLEQINIKIWLTRKGTHTNFDLYDKLLLDLIQMSFYQFNKLHFQSFKFPMNLFGLLPFVC